MDVTRKSARKWIDSLSLRVQQGLFAAATYPIQKLLRRKGGKHPMPEQVEDDLCSGAMPEGGEEPSPAVIADGETKE